MRMRELTGDGCSASAFSGLMRIVLTMKTQVLNVVYVLNPLNAVSTYIHSLWLPNHPNAYQTDFLAFIA